MIDEHDDDDDDDDDDDEHDDDSKSIHLDNRVYNTEPGVGLNVVDRTINLCRVHRRFRQQLCRGRL